MTVWASRDSAATWTSAVQVEPNADIVDHLRRAGNIDFDARQIANRHIERADEVDDPHIAGLVELRRWFGAGRWR